MCAQMMYPLASPSWDQAEIDALHRIIDSGFFSMGQAVTTFEQEFATFCSARFAVMVNSGSSANLLMVAALFYRQHGRALQRGDEVIVPAVSWSTTYYPLYQYGLKLRFVDIDLATLNYDLEALEAAITEKTRLIMAVNLLGNPNDFDRIQQIIQMRDILLIEDNCESMGAIFHQKQAGTFGLMGSFSSFFSHHISTMEGGLIVTDDEELYHILLSLRAHGWTRNLPQFNLVCGQKSTDPFEESFRFVLPGFNVRPLEMSGALGSTQLKKLPAFIEARRKNAQLFQTLFTDHPDFMIQQEIGESSWFGFSLVIRPDAKISRREVVKTLNENGIECRPIVAGNFAKNQVMKWFDYEISGELKNADWIDQNGLFVGNHHFSLESQLTFLRQLF